MPLPALTADGLLPPGIHNSSLEEIRRRFGAFQDTDQRPRLFDRLAQLADAIRRSGLFAALLIDGSFVTATSVPNDIDVLAVLKAGHDFERDLRVSQYALVSRVMLGRRFRLDVIVAEESSLVYKTYVEFFSRVRESPELRKGIVRLSL